MQSMIEMTAQDRLKRALRAKTRQPQEALQLSCGDQVDFYRPPTTKEESRWRGPATVVQVGPPVMQCRAQDLRRSLVYTVMLTTNFFFSQGSADPVNMAMSYADHLENKVVRIGWMFDDTWKRAQANEKLGELVMAVLHVAACGFT